MVSVAACHLRGVDDRMSELLLLRKFYGRDWPLSIVFPDGDPQTVKLVKPNGLYRPRLSVSEDYGLADERGLRFLERCQDR